MVLAKYGPNKMTKPLSAAPTEPGSGNKLIATYKTELIATMLKHADAENPKAL